ncbi:MAG: hypothetical protein MZV63_65125 [Marinilabiliales bacterium]|nr:hypothetical protein [Marinilabiliales bacterium]
MDEQHQPLDARRLLDRAQQVHRDLVEILYQIEALRELPEDRPGRGAPAALCPVRPAPTRPRIVISWAPVERGYRKSGESKNSANLTSWVTAFPAMGKQSNRTQGLYHPGGPNCPIGATFSHDPGSTAE